MRASNASKARRWRRGPLAVVALSCVVGPAIAGGCQPGFDPPSKVNGLRVLAVSADKPYAKAGEAVTFDLTYSDGLDPSSPRNVQIAWIGGCFDPQGDLYYGCYPQLGKILGAAASGGAGGALPPEVAKYVGIGPKFSVTLPDDIVTRRPVPDQGPRFGTAFVFFMVCAGKLGPAPATAEGKAGNFPIACFDEAGKQLGADSFVPGYTQIYAFEDERTNANPTITGITYDGNDLPDDVTKVPTLKACPLSDDDRRVQGCAKKKAEDACQSYAISVTVPQDVAEPDPEATNKDGAPLREVVWVDYYVDGGDLSGDVALLSEASTGYNDDHSVTWLPPDKPGQYSIWAVVHDNRGGTSIARRFVNVL
jgi:hypothetical protein